MPAEYVFRRQIPNRRLSVQMAPNGEFHQKGVGQLSETLEVSSVLNISGLEDDYEMCRELGRSLYLQEEIYPESKQDGLSLLIWASRHGDPEAKYYIGLLLLSGTLKSVGADSKEAGLDTLCQSANSGFIQARRFLNQYCLTQYTKTVSDGISVSSTPGPLVDFDGNRIHIDCSGVLTPIDAKLSYENGCNILAFYVNLALFSTEQGITDVDAFMRAVRAGIEDWAGDYEVFGGQKLEVRVEITSEHRAYDNVYILPFTNDIRQTVAETFDKYHTEKAKKLSDDFLTSKRSAAGVGMRKWSTKSRKWILIQSQSGRFDEYEEIRAVAKHEFGHALGLGDLYCSASDGLAGVEKGVYKELDSFYLYNKTYNLVMCDHHGPISNNDIEMVVLAFSQNKMQNYQPSKIKGAISAALGKGN